MKKFTFILILSLFVLSLAGQVWSQAAKPTIPQQWWPPLDRWIRTGTITFTNKTFTSPTFSGTSITNSATTNYNTGTNWYWAKDGDTLKINPYKADYVIDWELGNTRKFAIDSTGILLLTSGLTASNVTDNQLILTENSEDINIAFASNQINITSSTGVLSWDFGSINLETDKIDVSDGDIDNVGVISADALDPDATSLTVRTGVTLGNTLKLQVYDNDTGPAYTDGITLTAGNTPAVTLGGGVQTVEINSSDWDISTIGAITGLASYAFDNGLSVNNNTDNHLTITENSEDIDIEFAADLINVTSSTAVATVDFGTINLATDALDVSEGNITNVGTIGADALDPDNTELTIRTGTTASNTLKLQVYDNDTGPAYLNALTLTAGNSPAIELGDGGATIAVNSSDWDITATGIMTGIGNITTDGVINSTNHGATMVSDADIVVSNTIGAIHQTVFTITADAITITDAGVNGAHGSKKLIDFPQGAIKVVGVVSDISVSCGTSGLTATATYDYGLGSAAVGVDNDALSGSEQDVLTKVEGDLAASAADWNGYTGTDLTLNGTSAASAVYLNIAFEQDDASGADTATINGTITITWVKLGDY